MDQKHYRMAVALRHALHRHPELSMHEAWTKRRLMDFLRENTRLELFDGGHWFCAFCRGRSDQPPVAFRADMDALPIHEPPDLVPYASQVPGVGHKCGHDGHSAALAAFALELDAHGAGRDIYLLFQHAEETGQGAAECTAFLRERQVSEIYAFHNLPGLPLGAVAAPDGVAQYASTGMIVHFQGLESHASYPEQGRNPAFAISETVLALPTLTAHSRGFSLVTVIQVDIGERAFGTSAGSGDLLLTLRAEFEEELDQLRHTLEDLAREKAEKYGLTVSFAYEDPFPETFNHHQNVEKVRAAASRLGIPLAPMGERFRASEDFGCFTKEIPGAIFYLGDGDSPPLHSVEFDFPDQLIAIAADMFMELARS